MGGQLFECVGLITLTTLLLINFHESSGHVTVGVVINSFVNVNGTCYEENSSARKCCDGPQRADCQDGDTCDTYFQICVGRMESNWGCNGASLQTKPLNNTNAVYNLSRIEAETDFWSPGMGIFIFVRDSDSVGAFESNNHIDTLIQELKFDPGPDFRQSAEHQYAWNGTNVQMRISIEAWCSDGYYGTDCQKYCQAIKPVSMCASGTGDLICQSAGSLLLEFQSAVDNSMFQLLDLNINQFMDEQVCVRNNSNVQYPVIDSPSRSLIFEGFCNNIAVTPLEFESLLLVTPNTVLRRYFKPEVARGHVIMPRGYGEHIKPNVFVGVELKEVKHPAGTSYNGAKTAGERKCCDVLASSNCSKQQDTCDLEFSICIGDVSNAVCVGAVAISSVFDNSTSLSTCGPTLLDLTTGKTHVSHPMIGGMRLIKNVSSVQVLVKDIDLGTSFDTVDVLSTAITIIPGPNITSPQTLDITLKHYVTLKLRMIFWCTAGHTGPLCAAQNGTDHCEKGWSGVECSIPLDACHPNPCQNEGTCAIAASGSYNCTCTPGYSGPNCTQDVNECKLYHICQNNGTCHNSFGAFNCGCVDGWTGLICTQKLPHCNPSPCVHGVCSPVFNPIPGYLCKCNQGWSGRNCDQVDECTNSTCINGHCVIVDGIDICMCNQGYNGQNCTEDIDECLARPCKNNGVCLNTFGSYNCECPNGFSGRHCGVMPSNCQQNECQNHGTCVQNTTSSYCACPGGYTGPTCGQFVNKCASVKCEHGENCVERFDDYQCNCSEFWSGKTCDVDVNECSLSICQHASTCINLPGSYYCDCTTGWNGTICTTDINECVSSPCVHGTCANTNGSYVCQCHAGYTGQNCETKTQFCTTTFCSGHGSCSDGVNQGMCKCDQGYSGARCGINVDECVSGVCGSHSTSCTNTAGSYNCSCTNGWQGQNCSLDVNECDSTQVIPCSGNGFCINQPGTFQCNCLTGFSGPLCNKFANTCNDIKCFNNATCVIRDEGPACVCKHGWTGLKCETDINECEENIPCQNSGTCQNTDGSFVCTCYSGWTGIVCDGDVNECLDSTTCSHNGTCSNVPGTYDCACPAGWQGMSCEVISPTSLQGNVITFTFLENITTAYQQPMVSSMYHFLTAYVCVGKEVLLFVQSFVLNNVSVTATCGGVPVSVDTITDGLTRVPNETLPRLFPFSYQAVKQTSTLTTTSSPTTNGLVQTTVIAIAVSSVVFLLIVAGLTFFYIRRRRTSEPEPYLKMDDLRP